jgi:type I restriction enzyme M protein
VARRIRTATYFGQDLVDRPRRMALMNLYLHNIEPQIALGDAIYEPAAARRFDVVLTNPPFGTRASSPISAYSADFHVFSPRISKENRSSKH